MERRGCSACFGCFWPIGGRVERDQPSSRGASMGIWGQSLRVIKKVSLPGLCSGHISSWKPSGLVDGSTEDWTLCSCHFPCFLTTEKLCLVQLHRSLSLEPEFHMETEGPLLREASSVHTFISFPISEVLTGIRILGGNRPQVVRKASHQIH